MISELVSLVSFWGLNGLRTAGFLTPKGSASKGLLGWVHLMTPVEYHEQYYLTA